MPAKNRIKIYTEDGYYHIYNRGVEKRKIFMNEKDYVVFLGILKFYLSPLYQLQHPLKDANLPFNFRVKKTFSDEVELLAFCLMPNHFHLLIHQKNKNSIVEFMRAISTTYVMYFNKKYDRVGSLFQGQYKAALVLMDTYLLHLSKYIHNNPHGISAGSDPVNYPYSSYMYYLKQKKAYWIKPDFILSMISEDQEKQSILYRDFIINKPDTSLPKEIILE